MTPPRASVIVPVYNAEAHLRETLDSLVAQTIADIEIICVDDGSDDASATILAEYSARDERLRVISQEQSGGGAARNAGIDAATGEYLVMLDADDVFSPVLIDHAAGMLEDSGAEICLFNAHAFVDQPPSPAGLVGQYLRRDLLPRTAVFRPDDVADHLFQLATPAAWLRMYRRSHVIEKDLRFLPRGLADDVGFTAETAITAARIAVVDEPLVFYRMAHGGGQRSRWNDQPLAFADTLRDLAERMDRRGARARYELTWRIQTFNVMSYALRTITEAEPFETAYAAVRDELLVEYGIAGLDATMFVLPQLVKDYRSITTHSAEASPLHPDRRTPRPPAFPRVKSSARGNPEPGSKDGPLVSVVIPVYNTGHYLESSVRSVLEQSLREVDVIIVDDGSTDESPETIARLAAADARIRVIRQPNQGLSAARNVGAEAATGRFLYFFDSDDRLVPHALERLSGLAAETAADLVYFTADAFTDEPELAAEAVEMTEWYHREREYRGVWTGTELLRVMTHDKKWRQSACLQFFDRTWYIAHGLSFLPGILHEDNLFAVEAALAAERAVVINDALFLRRIRPDSITTKVKTPAHLYGLMRCIAELGEIAVRPGIEPPSRDAITSLVANLHRQALAVFEQLDDDERVAVAGMLTGAELSVLTMYGVHIKIRDRERHRRELAQEELLAIHASRGYRLVTLPRRLLRRRCEDAESARPRTGSFARADDQDLSDSS